MSLGSKIRELRISKGLTQGDLGAGLVTSSMISQIESDKANPSYKVLEAIAEKLEAPLEHFLGDVQSQLEEKTIHKIGHALLFAGKYVQATEVLLSVLERNPSFADRMELHLDLGDCYLHQGNYSDAVAFFEKALELADQNGNPNALHALNKLGQVEKIQHNYHAAVFYWRTAHQRFSQLALSEPFIQSQVLLNLSTIHQELGEFEQALGYLDEAYALIRDSQDTAQIGMVYLELGIGYEKCRDYSRAIEYAQYAAAIFETLHLTKLAIDTKVRYGVLMGQIGKLTEAYQVLEACVFEYEANHHPIDVARVRGKIATFYLREKRLEEAKQLCKEALSTVVNEHVEKATLLQTLGMIEDSLENYDAAIKNLDKAKNLFDQHGALHDKAGTLSMLGQLHQKLGNLTHANECLQEMKQTYDQLLQERGIIE